MKLKIPKIKKADLPIILGVFLIVALVLLAKLYFQPLYEKEISIENALHYKWTGFSIAVLGIYMLPKDLHGIKYVALALIIGCILNSTALAMNDGYMPVSAMIYVKGHHIPMAETARVPFLCDWILGGMSIGDLFLFIPLPIVGILLVRYWKKQCTN